jgi:multicomponent Na+:H+ antiporter subunit C
MLIKFPFYLSAIIFFLGVFLIIYPKNYFHKLLGMSILQVSVLVFFVILGKVTTAAPPVIMEAKNIIYSSPLPHVLMLTAIVVGIATVSMAIALLLKINKNFGTLEEDEF